jgi:hypothetical protein
MKGYAFIDLQKTGREKPPSQAELKGAISEFVQSMRKDLYGDTTISASTFEVLSASKPGEDSQKPN